LKRNKRKAMRRGLCILLAACLALCPLAGCSARQGETDAGAPAVSAASPDLLESSSLPEESSSGKTEEQGEPLKEISLQPGKILALGDLQRPELSEGKLAEQSELTRWEELVFSGEIARLDAGGMSEDEKELSPESAAAILNILKEARLSLYEAQENPPTGGSYAVYAYAADDSRLFSAVYNGAWLSVQFAEEDSSYIFNGEEGGFERLGEYIE
jgi:hypothetical protein